MYNVFTVYNSGGKDMKPVKRILAVIFCALMVFAAAAPAFAEEGKTIGEVRLSVTEPKAGEAPDMNIVSAEPEKYTAKVRYWIKQLHGNDPVTVFEAGYEYGMVFEVTPVNGYRFEAVQKNEYNFDESPTVVYINDIKAGCVSAETDTKLGRSFNVTVEEEPVEETDFFMKIINAIKDFFTGIIDFFRNLF